MEFKGNFITKMIGVDKAFNTYIQNALRNQSTSNSVKYPQLNKYRMEEYRAWASSNSNNLLAFYKNNIEPTYNRPDDRNLFWQWVGGINVPKVHYPAPEIIISHTKSILFSGDITIEPYHKEATENDLEYMFERIDKMKEDINFDDLLNNGSFYETYSGTLAAKFVIEKEVHDKPIIQLYPREKVHIETKYGKVQTITFIDKYYKDTKEYTLNSIYGKGFIEYYLYDQNGRPTGLHELEETKDLRNFYFKPNIILAAWKKNKTVSNEFPELIYGGSDFEGITDLFHSIDEIFSTMVLYIRRNRPVLGISEGLLPVTNDGSKTKIPKEYEMDYLPFRNIDTGNGNVKDLMFRDNPKIETAEFMNSIKELMLSAYQKVGISYATVNDSGIGANASGESIAKREKTTAIMRDSKIKLWIPFIQDICRLYLTIEDYMDNGYFGGVEPLLETYNTYKEWSFTTLFPDYNGQTFREKVEEANLAIQAGVMDIKHGIEHVYGDDIEEDEKKEMLVNIKLENGTTILQEELNEE